VPKPTGAPGRYVPTAPLSLADAASQLGVRPVQLAQAIREGKVATVRGRGGELLIAREELERVRREGLADRGSRPGARRQEARSTQIMRKLT
jgi:hypothetical protein